MVGLTVQPIEDRGLGEFTLTGGGGAVFKGPGVYGGSLDPAYYGTGVALSVSELGPGLALDVATAAGTEDHGNPLSGDAVHVAAALDGVGVTTTSATGRALVAGVTGSAATSDTVVATNAGHGRAVLAQSAGSQATVTALTTGSGPAVYGRGSNTNSAVIGINAGPGAGGTFAGQRAAVRLTPAASPTHPASGLAGDLYVDAADRLWFCQGGSRWKQLA